MGGFNKPIPTKCWEKFLKSCNCGFVRQKSSHHLWKCPNAIRTITFWGDKKDVPRFHINSNLESMGKTKKEFNDWIKENC